MDFASLDHSNQILLTIAFAAFVVERTMALYKLASRQTAGTIPETSERHVDPKGIGS